MSDIEEIDNIAGRLIKRPEYVWYPWAKFTPRPKTGKKFEDMWLKENIVNEEEKEGQVDIITKSDDAEDVTIEIEQGHQEGIKVKRFLELVESGKVPWEAARAMGSNMKTLTKNVDIREAVKKLIEGGRLPQDVRKQMVRDALDKILMDNVNGGSREQKIALGAAKEIAKDPDVGLNTAPVVGVQVNVGNLQNLMGKLKPIAGFEDILEIKEGD